MRESKYQYQFRCNKCNYDTPCFFISIGYVDLGDKISGVAIPNNCKDSRGNNRTPEWKHEHTIPYVE